MIGRVVAAILRAAVDPHVAGPVIRASALVLVVAEIIGRVLFDAHCPRPFEFQLDSGFIENSPLLPVDKSRVAGIIAGRVGSQKNNVMKKQAPLSDGAVRRLSSLQRNLLIDHIDGAVAIVRAVSNMAPVRNSLIGFGLLMPSPANTPWPRATVLTERGREAVAMILGDYADALVRAGLLEQPNPLAVLRRLRAARQPENPPVSAKPGTLAPKLA